MKRCARRLTYSFVLVLAAVSPAYALTFSGADVEGIRKAVAEFYAGPLTQISATSPRCKNTAEDGCQGEVQVTVSTPEGPKTITVSKVDNRWIVGKRQREVIDRQRSE